jgi:hypothetical protein
LQKGGIVGIFIKIKDTLVKKSQLEGEHYTSLDCNIIQPWITLFSLDKINEISQTTNEIS